ncbi:MAG: BTAD domain-containing putative transcriptional regulator [Roseiflexaceae bacterium]
MLVLDDAQLLDQSAAIRDLIDTLASHLPERLHLILLARHEPALNALNLARAHGQLLLIRQADLAFNDEEARALFAQAGVAAPGHLDAMLAEARGWPIALQLLVDAVRRNPEQNNQINLRDLAETLDCYVEREILDTFAEPFRSALIDTAAMNSFDPMALTALIPPEQASILARQIPFVELSHDRRQRYQPLFAAALQRIAQRRGSLQLVHTHLASYYRSAGEISAALHHLIAAADHHSAAELLEQAAASWPAVGRANELLEWVARLPEAERQRPGLLLLSAAAYRRLGQFEAALAEYAHAEAAFLAHADDEGRSLALRGMAEIYLDTVQPAPAAALLKQALKLLPRERGAARAAILKMQAENWANRGRADVALILEQAARTPERPHIAEQPSNTLPPRLLLRSGRLQEARSLLEHDLGLHHSTNQPAQSFHREPQLLLALIDMLLGNGVRALAMAKRGLLEAQQGNARLTEAIALMRLGHAIQIMAPRDPAANASYQEALELIQAAGVARTRAEAYLGLTLLHSHAGDLAAALDSSRAGLQLAEQAGDEWTAALIWLALASGAVAHEDPQGPAWLDQARQRFRRGGDRYGLAAVGLWSALDHVRAGRITPAINELTALLDVIERNGYTGLLTSPTLFGPRDLTMLIPLLLLGRAPALRDTRQGLFAQHLLRHAYPTIASDELIDTYHPGFTLRVQLLGGFRVWRGSQEIQSREWQREKSRQLLQLLLNYRGQWLQREQICAWLWPESDIEAAERQFKVTLNALNVALEPRRPPRVAPFFIRRQGLAYSFAPSYGCWIDVDEFELRSASLSQAEPELAIRNGRAAVALYRGDYLPELLYEPWTFEERERLHARYLAIATELAQALVKRGELAEAIDLAEQIIRRDRCYEEAYQVLMLAHARSGSRSQALRSYTRCEQALRDELGIEPLPETSALYEQIKRHEVL